MSGNYLVYLNTRFFFILGIEKAPSDSNNILEFLRTFLYSTPNIAIVSDKKYRVSSKLVPT